MECRDAQFYLRFHRAGADDLGPEVAADLDRHLAACPSCALEARVGAGFDAALRGAMSDVPVPVGLRNRLVAHVAAQRGTALRMRAYRYAGLAAAVLLTTGIALGLFAGRPQFDVYALMMKGDAQADNPEEAVRKWLTEQRVPAELPEPFDFSLLVSYGVERVQGRDVPVVVFRDRLNTGFAKVYVLRPGEFNLKELQGAQQSHCRAVVYTDGRQTPGTAFVIIHTGPNLSPFLKTHGGNLA